MRTWLIEQASSMREQENYKHLRKKLNETLNEKEIKHVFM